MKFSLLISIGIFWSRYEGQLLLSHDCSLYGAQATSSGTSQYEMEWIMSWFETIVWQGVISGSLLDQPRQPIGRLLLEAQPSYDLNLNLMGTSETQIQQLNITKLDELRSSWVWEQRASMWEIWLWWCISMLQLRWCISAMWLWWCISMIKFDTGLGLLLE